jgi:DNA-directed RNA polymerase specialized sigma24 family protein
VASDGFLGVMRTAGRTFSLEGEDLDEGLGLPAQALHRLRQALMARYGDEVGLEAYQDAVAYAWEHRQRLFVMENPIGYLFRVAQTSVRRQRRASRAVGLPPAAPASLPEVEPQLVAALEQLSDMQRAAVLLVHAHGWTLDDAAGVLGVGRSTVRNHLARGLERLRRRLGVDDV